MRTNLVSVTVVSVLLFWSAACGSDDTAGTAPGTVEATLKDFQITLAETSASAGKVTFAVHNDGPSTHEFVVFKTDLAADALPKDDNGDVAESDTFKAVDELENITKASDPTLTVDLEAGHYVVICNLPGHYRQGMHAELTVT